MTNTKVVGASSLPTIDRGTDARAKMSRKRFLAFIMVGLMIVSAVSMIAPSILGNSQDNGNDQTADSSRWPSALPANAREAIYKVDHLFESYMKAVNFTKAAHGNGIGSREVFLGHHSQTIMGVNNWLNTSVANSPRQTKYSEMTLRNSYPYIFFWNPNPTGGAAPTLPCGLETWAPYRLTAIVQNDTSYKTGLNDHLGTGRNVPFVPYLNRLNPADNFAGGYLNMSLYGTYMAEAELGTNTLGLRGGLHYGNWFYGMPSGVTPAGTGNDGYFFELHGTYQFSRRALITFLGMPAATADARTWFAANVGVGGMPAGYDTLTAQWRSWMWENYSQAGSPGPARWNNTVNNDNIYCAYEFDMQASLGLYVSMKLDPLNYTNANQLAIRVYTMGWGPDAALIRMLEKANVTGSILSSMKGSWITSGGQGYYKNRAPMLNYGEDISFNSSVSPRQANSTYRCVNTYAMIGWEDSDTTVWMGGYQIPIGSHADYIPTTALMNSYQSPFD